MTRDSEPVAGLIEICTPMAQAEVVAGVLARLARHGVPLIARIDHAAAAREAGLALLPTEVLIFGNAKAGTPLMCARSLFAIDLPLRLLVQQMRDGGTRLCYSDPAWIAARHHLPPANEPIVNAMEVLLATIVEETIADRILASKD